MAQLFGVSNDGDATLAGVSGCPPEEKLEAFSRGLLPATEREEVATHAVACAVCGPKLSAALFASPLPSHRRISNDLLASVDLPAKVRDMGVADTEIASGERDPAAKDQTYARGSTLARYVILERLAKGGMGEVYAAYDPDLDRKVAIKLLRSDFRGASNANEMRLRLLREAQAMARLSHPNVVTVHDVGLVGDQVFVAMEFIEGETVTQWLKLQPRSWAQVLDVYLSAGRGLAAAHAVGLTHRDFKPDNVVVGKDKRVRVMDFGLAHAQAAPSTPTPQPDPLVESGSGGMKRKITPPGAIMGTPAYMAPEQFYGKPTDPRSDQFSFCVALYEGMYGERPYAGESPGAIVVEIEQARVRPPPRDSSVPTRIRKLLLRGLSGDPAQRFRAIDALLIGLSRRRSAVRRQWSAIGAGSVVLITVIAAIQATRSASQRCAQVSARLGGVWDKGVKEQARTAFLSTRKPWAERAWNDASKAIDAYTTRWVALRKEVLLG